MAMAVERIECGPLVSPAMPQFRDHGTSTHEVAASLRCLEIGIGFALGCAQLLEKVNQLLARHCHELWSPRRRRRGRNGCSHLRETIPRKLIHGRKAVGISQSPATAGTCLRCCTMAHDAWPRFPQEWPSRARD